MWTALALLALLLAAVPCGLFIANLREYRRLPSVGGPSVVVSVLIPARDEEANISATLDSVLSAHGVELEVIVLDDHSTDGTAAVVREFASRDARVRLVSGQSLPSGWCGKNFACQQLAQAAQHPLLIFMDADVRVSRPDSLARLAVFLQQAGAALVSGIPRQETQTFMEKVIIPLIHFVLLGFLPIRRMRVTADPRFAAGCGQILAVIRGAYFSTGGHASIRDRIHDAVALTRAFRAHGLATDLFDATDAFHCRMYASAAQVWHGFAKNAHEGLGSQRLIIPSTLVLIGGQVLPLVALAFSTSGAALIFSALAAAAAFLPRLIAVARFRQSLLGALLHPLGICLVVAIQWFAFFRSLRERPAVWKGRSYSPIHMT